MKMNKLLLVMIVGIFLFSCTNVSAFWETKNFDKDLGKYGQIEINDYFFLNKADYRLTDYGNSVINAWAEGEYTLHKKTHLFTGIFYKDILGGEGKLKNVNFYIWNNETEIRYNPIYENQNCYNDTNYTEDEASHGMVINGTIERCDRVLISNESYEVDISGWVSYEKGMKIDKGEGRWKLTAEKPKNVKVDFILEGHDYSFDEWSWWNSTFNYKRTIGNLTGNFSYMNITYDAHMQADFDDLRFLDSSETIELNFTIEDKSNNNWVTIRVYNKDSSIYMYYGNADVTTTSSASDTYFEPVNTYYLDEQDTTGTGIIIDSSNINNMTNNQSDNVTGILNTAYNFDGTGERIDGNYGIVNGDFSVGMWVYWDDIARASYAGIGFLYISYDLSDGNPLVQIWTSSSALTFRMRGDSGVGITSVATGTLSNDQWYYIVATYNSIDDAMKLYVDAGTPFTNTYNGGAFTTLDTTIIGSNPNSANPFSGTLDEIKRWNKVLTPDQIQQLYSQNEPSYTLGAEESPNTAPTITANVTKPDTVNQNTDYLVNLTIEDIDVGDTLTGYVQFYVNGTSTSTEQSAVAVNGTTTLIGTLSYGNFSGGDNLTAQVWAGDGTANTTKVYLISSIVTFPPSVTNLIEFPTDPATFSQSTIYQFNSTITDNGILDDIILEFNGTNYTATNISADIFNVSFANLSVGVYNYRWFANDTEGNINNTATGSYTINQATPEGTLTSNIGWIINETQEVTIGLSESNTGDDDVTYIVSRDNVAKGTGETWTPAYGTYSYVLNTTGGVNWSENVNMDTQTLTVLDTTYPLISYNEGTMSDYSVVGYDNIFANVSITETNLEDMSYYLYNSSINTTGLAGWWSFDRYSSSALDWSGEGNDGTWNGYTFNNGEVIGATLNETGKYGKAYDFDGNYIDCNNNSELNPKDISFGAWIKINSGVKSLDKRMGIISKDYLEYELFLDSSGGASAEIFKFYKSNGVGNYEEAAYSFSFQEETWYHVFLTFDSSSPYNANWYINGVLKKSHNFSSSNINHSVGHKLLVGARNHGGALSGFDGTIDEVRIWNRALNQTEIQEEMNNANPVNGDGLVSSWSFEQNNATHTFDTNNLVAGKVGQAARFDGVDDYILINPGIPDTMTEMTFSTWVYSKNNVGRHQIFWGYGDGFITAINNNKFYWYLSNISSSTSYISGSIDINEDEWTHLVLVYNGSHGISYVNGEHDRTSSTTISGALDLSQVTSHPIGTSYDRTTYWLNGSIDDVRIYNRSLSQTEITEIYNSRLVNKTTFETETTSINWTGLADNNYNYFVDILDESGNYNFTEVRNLIIDTTSPSVTNLVEYPTDPATYSLGTIYHFNATVTDTNTLDDIIFEFNGVNYTATNLSADFFNVSIENLQAGVYNYRWFTNDTAGNLNNTVTGDYTINKAVSQTSLTFDVDSPQTYGTAITPTCSVTTGDGPAVLTYDGNVIISGIAITLGADTYSFNCSYTENANYTGSQNVSSYTINKAIPIGSLTSTLGWTMDRGETVTIGLSESNTGDDDVTYIVHRDNVEKGTGETWTPSAGTYTYLLNTTGGANWTANSTMNFVDLVVLPSNPNITALTEYPSDPTNYSQSTVYQFNATILDANTLDDIIFEFNGTNYTATNLSANVFNVSFINLTAGTYNYRWFANDTLGNINNTETGTYIIDKATPSLTLSATTPITYGTITDFSGGGCPAQLSCSLDITNNVYAAGTITGNYSTAGNINYTSAYANFTVTINKASLVGSITGVSVINYTNMANITANETNNNDSDVVYILYRNNVTVSNPDNTVLGVGSYFYHYNSTGGQNYTANNDIANFTLTIDKATAEVYAYVGNLRANYLGNNLTAINEYLNGSLNIGLGNIKMYLNNSLIASGSPPLYNITDFPLGSYYFNVTYDGNDNYTSDEEHWSINITVWFLANLTGVFNLNADTGTTAYDISGNMNNGTIEGASWEGDSITITLLDSIDYSINKDTGLFVLLNDARDKTLLAISYTYYEYDDDFLHNVVVKILPGILILLIIMMIWVLFTNSRNYEKEEYLYDY